MTHEPSHPLGNGNFEKKIWSRKKIFLKKSMKKNSKESITTYPLNTQRRRFNFRPKEKIARFKDVLNLARNLLLSLFKMDMTLLLVAWTMMCEICQHHDDDATPIKKQSSNPLSLLLFAPLSSIEEEDGCGKNACDWGDGRGYRCRWRPRYWEITHWCSCSHLRLPIVLPRFGTVIINSDFNFCTGRCSCQLVFVFISLFVCF